MSNLKDFLFNILIGWLAIILLCLGVYSVYFILDVLKSYRIGQFIAMFTLISLFLGMVVTALFEGE